MRAPLKIHLVAAARPNFMKIAPLYRALNETDWAHVEIVHTGQHYDVNMSDSFFHDLELPPPTYHLSVGSGSHAEQTAKVMVAYEQLCLVQPPTLTIVVGDVNSTLACALVAAKLQIPTIHLESGLRSRDRSMPEEINRIATDHICDLLWSPSSDATENLLQEGIETSKIDEVGNVMIDSLEFIQPKLSPHETMKKYGVSSKEYFLLTLHRPSNVDSKEMLSSLIGAIGRISQKMPILFPIHPRTQNQLRQFQISLPAGMIPIDPLSYREFMSLVLLTCGVITDSGGIQEETSYLNIPCFTLRPNTERPITIHAGTNHLVTADTLFQKVIGVMQDSSSSRKVCSIPGWDGNAALRMRDSLHQHFIL